MRKKLYLVALFCGALCLTGCLKNEESASVTQVRFAKANELNSLAALNNAKAQATTIAAEAEAAYKAAQAKIAEAEAKLKEAEAAYKDAETQLKLVEVELKGVEVQIQLVKLDEEKIELEKKKLELEKARAELEVAKAKADADKAQWIAKLEDIQREAAINAAQDELSLRTAQQNIEDYAAQLDAAKAAAVKKAANQYFKALATVTDLNNQLINATVAVAKATYDNEAAVKDQLEAITTAQQNVEAQKAGIEKLKKLATMTEEEVEAEKAAAEAALIAALENLDAATKARAKASSDESAEFALKSKFFDETDHDWSDFTGDLTKLAKYVNNASSEEVNVKGYGNYTVYGYIEPNDDPLAKPVFVPLYNKEDILHNNEQYPDSSIYSTTAFPVYYDNLKIVPASINYANAEKLGELALEKYKAKAAAKVDELKKDSAKQVEAWQKEITEKTETFNLHKDYVANREKAVKDAEDTLKKYLNKYNLDQNKEAGARKAYQEYMLKKYDIKREVFETYWKAIDDTLETAEEYWAAKADSATTYAAYKTLSDKSAASYVALMDAKKAYVDAKDAYETGTAKKELDDALKVWDPEFSWEAIDAYPYYKNVKNYGSSQLTMVYRYSDLKAAEKTLADAKAAYLADKTDPAAALAFLNATEAVDTQTTIYNDAKTAMDAAETTYNTKKAAADEAKTAVDEAAKAWDPDYGYATVEPEKNDKGEWVKVVGTDTYIAGTSQAAREDALRAALEAKAKFDTAEAAWNTAKSAHEPKLADYDTAWTDLCTALDVEKEKYVKDEDAQKLFEATKIAALEKSKVEDKFKALTKLYTVSAVDEPYGTGKVKTSDFGWAISNFEIDPSYEYISSIDYSKTPAELKKKTVAEFFGYGAYDTELEKYVPDESKSLKGQIAELEEDVKDEPDNLAKQIEAVNTKIANTEKKIDDLMEKINAYKEFEADYTKWVASREATVKAYIETSVAYYVAKAEKEIAVKEYEAAHGDFYNKLNYDGTDYTLVEVSVQEAIKDAEAYLKTLEEKVAKEQHNLVVLQMNNEAWEAQVAQNIAVIESKIEVYSAIAEYYKAILDGLMDAAGILPDEEEVPAE